MLHHYCNSCNQTGQTINAYVDGKLRGTTALAGAACQNNNGDNQLFIGATVTGGENWDGKIQEVYVWNRTLGLSEILSLNSTIYNSATGTFIGASSVYPIISDIKNRTTITTAMINWTTDLVSNSSVNYGLTKSLGTWYRTNNMTKNHNVTLTGLAPNTKYYFNVSSCRTSLCTLSGYNVFITKAVTINLSINAASPPTYRQFNTPINFQANITTNLTTINCSLNVDGSTLTSKLVTTKQANFTRSFAVGNHTWDISCTNRTTYKANMTSRYFYFDTTSPTVVTPFKNNSLFFMANLTTQFNLSDDYQLFSVNVSIDNVQKKRITNFNSSFYQLNFTNSVKSLSPSSHQIELKLCDGHTLQNIADEIVSIGTLNNYLSYELNKKSITIKNNNPSVFDKWSTQKQPSKYTWTYEPNTKISTQIFTIDSDSAIYIKQKNNYKWIITDNRWIDFDIINENEVLDIKQINPKRVEVTISNIKNYPSKLSFNSIGELNCIWRNYTFFRTNVTESHASPLTESSQNNLAFYINKTGITAINTSATLYYNGTSYAAAKTSTSKYDRYVVNLTIPLLKGNVNSTIKNNYWSFTLNSNSFTKLFNQTIYRMYIFNCSTGRRAIEFNASPEGSTSLININWTGTFRTWITSRTVSRNTTFTITTRNSSSICILPNSTLNMDYSIEYSKSGYLTRHKTVFGGWLNTTLQKVRLYLVPTASGTTITMALIDQVSNPLKGYIFDMRRYDFATNSYISVQSETTDVLGYSTFFNYISSTKYNFNIFNTTGGLVFNTGDMYLVTNPTTIRIQVGQSSDHYLTKTYQVWNLRHHLTYNNGTHIFKLEWFTLSGTTGEICMNISQTNKTRQTWLSGQCSSSNYGNLTYNATGKSGTVTAVAYVTGSPPYILDMLSIILTIRQTIKDVFGTEGFLVYFCLMVASATMLLVDITLIPVGMALVMIGTYMIGISPLSIGMLFAYLIVSILIANRVNEG